MRSQESTLWGTSRDSTFFRLFRALSFFQDFDLAHLLLHLHPGAGYTLRISEDNRLVQLISPVAFAEEYRSLREKGNLAEQAALCNASTPTQGNESKSPNLSDRARAQMSRLVVRAKLWFPSLPSFVVSAVFFQGETHSDPAMHNVILGKAWAPQFAKKKGRPRCCFELS